MHRHFMKCLLQKKLKEFGIDLSLFLQPNGSWLNMAEIELRVLNGQCLNRRIATIEKLKTEVEASQKYRNYKNAKINWQFKTEDARIKLKRLYPSIQC